MLPYYELPTRSIFLSHGKCSQNYPAHFHNSLEITYCFYGIQPIRISDKVYELKEGDAAVIFPNTVHEHIRCENPPKTKSLSIICQSRLINRLVPCINDTIPQNPYITEVPEDTKRAFFSITDVSDELAMVGWTCIIISGLFSRLELVSTDYAGETDIIQRLTSYVAANFTKPLTLEYIARHFGMNKSYLSHVFSDKIKINFRDYINTMRAEHAAMLIRSTSNDLTTGAYDSGFGSQRSFNRAFMSAFHMTPSQYRKSVSGLRP